MLSVASFSQEQTTLKITDVVINLNGEKIGFDQTFVETLTSTIPI